MPISDRSLVDQAADPDIRKWPNQVAIALVGTRIMPVLPSTKIPSFSTGYIVTPPSTSMA